MFRSQVFDRLDLYDNTILYDNIGKILSDDFALVKDLNRILKLCEKAKFYQLNDQCIYIYFFQKAVAKRIVDRKEGFYDFVSYFCIFKVIHIAIRLFCVHLRLNHRCFFTMSASALMKSGEVLSDSVRSKVRPRSTARLR